MSFITNSTSFSRSHFLSSNRVGPEIFLTQSPGKNFAFGLVARETFLYQENVTLKKNLEELQREIKKISEEGFKAIGAAQASPDSGRPGYVVARTLESLSDEAPDSHYTQCYKKFREKFAKNFEPGKEGYIAIPLSHACDLLDAQVSSMLSFSSLAPDPKIKAQVEAKLKKMDPDLVKILEKTPLSTNSPDSILVTQAVLLGHISALIIKIKKERNDALANDQKEAVNVLQFENTEKNLKERLKTLEKSLLDSHINAQNLKNQCKQLEGDKSRLKEENSALLKMHEEERNRSKVETDKRFEMLRTTHTSEKKRREEEFAALLNELKEEKKTLQNRIVRLEQTEKNLLSQIPLKNLMTNKR